MLTIIKKGVLATVQDGGRYGYQRFGVPVCGAMDKHSMSIANILAGNPKNGGVIEIMAGGFEARFEQPNIFALSGADMGAKLDGVPILNNKAYLAKTGQVLTLGLAVKGFYSYLALCGGLEIKPVLGSESTYLKGGFGGIAGRALEAGDKIGFRQPQVWLENLSCRVWSEREKNATLRVVLGPQSQYFCFRGIKTFLTSGYKLLANSDRMGYRLSGTPIDYEKGQDGNIISDGIVMGSVQVSGGQPMVMMADRQTTGGYAKIATVIGADLSVLAQKRPGESVCFEQVGTEQARGIYLSEMQILGRFEEDINERPYMCE